jgi:WD40 repeat protein
VVGCHVSREGAIASASTDGTVGIWEPPRWRLRHGLKGDDRGGMSVCAWSPDERWVASGDSDGKLWIWNALNGRLHACRRGHAQIIRACAISSDGRLCATGSADRTVRLWTLPDAEPRGLLPTTGGVWCLAFHPHEPLLICGGDGFVRVLETRPTRSTCP